MADISGIFMNYKLKLSIKSMLAGERRLVLAGAVIILLALGLLAYSVQTQMRNRSALTCGYKREGSLLSEAIRLVDPNDEVKMQQLETVVEKLQETAGYKDSYDCIYATVVHYIYTGDKYNARKNYEYLKAAQEKGQTLDKAYTYRVSPDDLKTQIDLFDAREKEDAENALVF